MVFNIIFKNVDDHLKNHSFIYNKEKNSWNLAPAYDLTFALNPLLTFKTTSRGLSINDKRTEINLKDLLVIADTTSKKTLSLDPQKKTIKKENKQYQQLIVNKLKMKTLKFKILLILLFSFCALTFNAQETIVPLKLLNELDEDFILDNNAYVKDINGLLNKFIGTWKSVFNGRSYEFTIQKHIDNKYVSEYKKDILIMSYHVKNNNNGNTISKNTIADSVNFNENPTIYGISLNDNINNYKFYYSGGGQSSRCDRSGLIYVNIKQNDLNSMSLYLDPSRNFFRSDLCPNGMAPKIIPTNVILLKKYKL